MKPTSLARASILALAAVLCAACAHQAVRKAPAASSSAPHGEDSASLAQTEPSVRDAAMISIPELKNVYFSLNSDRLSADSERTLSGNAAWLKEHADVRVQVAGNCDQRGTVEYNLALGQRRAAAVRRYYQLLGVPGARVATISYGKERPVCSDAAEACWRRNRRAETLAAVSQNVSSNASARAQR